MSRQAAHPGPWYHGTGRPGGFEPGQELTEEGARRESEQVGGGMPEVWITPSPQAAAHHARNNAMGRYDYFGQGDAHPRVYEMEPLEGLDPKETGARVKRARVVREVPFKLPNGKGHEQDKGYYPWGGGEVSHPPAVLDMGGHTAAAQPAGTRFMPMHELLALPSPDFHENTGRALKNPPTVQSRFPQIERDIARSPGFYGELEESMRTRGQTAPVSIDTTQYDDGRPTLGGGHHRIYFAHKLGWPGMHVIDDPESGIEGHEDEDVEWNRAHPFYSGQRRHAAAGPLGGCKEEWQPGERPHFEYHCLESDDSNDAALWHRSHQQVTVLHRHPRENTGGWEGSTFAERTEEGAHDMYHIRFGDGHEGDVFEDELVHHPRHFYRPDPPPMPKQAAAQSGLEYHHLLQGRKMAHPFQSVMAAHDGEVVGHLSWGPGNPDVQSLWVHPDYRHRGIATALWGHAQALDKPPQHSLDRSDAGDAWARSVTPGVPDRKHSTSTGEELEQRGQASANILTGRLQKGGDRHITKIAARPRIPRGNEACGCCGGTGEHADGHECYRCDASGYVPNGSREPYCPGQNEPKRRHWREGAVRAEEHTAAMADDEVPPVVAHFEVAAMAWNNEHGDKGKYTPVSVRDAGFAGLVGDSEDERSWREETGEPEPGHRDPWEHFDEDLHDNTAPEPTEQERREHEEDGESESYTERHDQAYEKAFGERERKIREEDTPDYEDPGLRRFREQYGSDTELWKRHGAFGGVSLRQPIYATQSHVAKEHIEKYTGNRDAEGHAYTLSPDRDRIMQSMGREYLGDKHPLFVTHEGRVHVIEGHHRVATDMATGRHETVGWHFNLDKHPALAEENEGEYPEGYGEDDEHHPHKEAAVQDELPELHRGIAVKVPPEVHAVVSDESRPMRERAQHLLDHVTREGLEPLGQHWTTSEKDARFFTHYNSPGAGGPGWQKYQVVFHAAHPGEHAVIHDPGWREEHEVNDEESEVPVEYGTDMDVHGITWRHKSGYSGGTGPVHEGEWHTHRFAEPQDHTAAVISHFEAKAATGRMNVDDLLDLHSNEALRRERAQAGKPVGHSDATRVRTLYDRKAAEMAQNEPAWSRLDEPIRNGTIDPVLLETSSTGHTVVTEGGHRIVRARQLGVTHLPVSYDPGSQAHRYEWDDPEPLEPKEAASPGEYGIRHRPTENGAPMHDLTGEAPDADFDKTSYNATDYLTAPPRYYSDTGENNNPEDREAIAQMKRVQGKPDALVDIYRATHKDAPHEINTGDWVTLSRGYAEKHAYAESGSDDPEAQYRVHHARVPAKHVRDGGGGGYREQGYWGPSTGCCDHHKSEVVAHFEAEPTAEQQIPYMKPPGPGAETTEHILQYHTGIERGHPTNLSREDLGLHGDDKHWQRWHNAEHRGRIHETHQHLGPVGTPGEAHWPDTFESSEHYYWGNITGERPVGFHPENYGGFHPLAPAEGALLRHFAVANPDELPPDPGTQPIPEGHVRLWHYTPNENVPSIREHGLQRKYAQGDAMNGDLTDPSAGMWASTKRPDELLDSHDSAKSVVEFHAHPREISGNAESPWQAERKREPGQPYEDREYDPAKLADWASGYHHVIMHGDVHPSQILAIHEPWHAAARYMRDDKDGPQSYQWVRGEYAAGGNDHLEPYVRGLDALERQQRPKEAARHQAALENPYTHHSIWYHGTQADPADIREHGLHAADEFAHGRFEVPESETDDSGHWNAMLGVHFTADHEIAGEFARGEHEGSDNEGYGGEDEDHHGIIHARVHLNNPKFYDSEHDLDHDAYQHEFAAGNHPQNHHPGLGKHYEGEPDFDDPDIEERLNAEEMWPHAHRIAQDYGRSEIPASTYGHHNSPFEQHPMRTTWLNTHPDKYGIAMRHKKRLMDQGYDGVVYRNEYERSNRGGAANTSIIAFHPDKQVEITQHHDVDEAHHTDQGGDEHLATLASLPSADVVTHFAAADAWQQTDEHGTYDDETGLRHDPDKGWWCHGCQAHHDSPEEVEEHDTGHTDWDEIYPQISQQSLHRGISVHLPQHLHEAVHDSSRPVAERARLLSDHLATTNYGTSWSTNPDRADHYAYVSEAGPGATHVIMRAHMVPRESIETDPDELGDRRVIGYDKHEDQEVPLRRGAAVNVHTIEWRRAPDRDGSGREPFTSHSFGDRQTHLAAGEPQRHTAAGQYIPAPEGSQMWQHLQDAHGVTAQGKAPGESFMSGLHDRFHAGQVADRRLVVHHHEAPAPGALDQDSFISHFFTPAPAAPKPAYKPEPERLDDNEYSLGDVSRRYDWEGFDKYEIEHLVHDPEHATFTREDVPVHSLRQWAPGGKLKKPITYKGIARQGKDERDRLAEVERGMDQGATPPIVVVRDGEHHIIADGSHRSAIAAERGHSHIEAFVTDRTKRDGEHTAAVDDWQPGDERDIDRARAQQARTARDERSDRWHEYQNRYSEDLHRGIHVVLPDHLHAYVHDESQPREKRAQALQQHFADSGEGLGMHWTPSTTIANRAILNAASPHEEASHGAWRTENTYGDDDEAWYRDNGYDDDEQDDEPEERSRHTEVMFHIKRPGERNRMRNPETLDRYQVGWQHSPDESEFPLKPGSPVRLSGISWKEHDPEHDMEPYEHHDFAKPIRHLASRKPEIPPPPAEMVVASKVADKTLPAPAGRSDVAAFWGTESDPEPRGIVEGLPGFFGAAAASLDVLAASFEDSPAELLAPYITRMADACRNAEQDAAEIAGRLPAAPEGAWTPSPEPGPKA